MPKWKAQVGQHALGGQLCSFPPSILLLQSMPAHKKRLWLEAPCALEGEQRVRLLVAAASWEVDGSRCGTHLDTTQVSAAAHSNLLCPGFMC